MTATFPQVQRAAEAMAKEITARTRGSVEVWGRKDRLTDHPMPRPSLQLPNGDFISLDDLAGAALDAVL